MKTTKAQRTARRNITNQINNAITLDDARAMLAHARRVDAPAALVTLLDSIVALKDADAAADRALNSQLTMFDDEDLSVRRRPIFQQDLF